MMRTTRQDMIVISMGIDALLECVRQTEVWFRGQGDAAALHRTEQLLMAIHSTRRKFFGREETIDGRVTEARMVAEGLRDAALQCHEGQAALHARLVSAAKVIEEMCRTKELP